MFGLIRRFYLPLGLLLALGMAALINLQLNSVPMVRTAPRHPVYTLSQASDADAVARGESIVKLGPCLFGLYPGTQAFPSEADARDYRGARGLDSQQWRIFRLSGDYQLDVTDGVLNKSLQLAELMP
ncbi:hypothetical protein [Pseudaeromonas paramecii]|uniref:Uncharacterized protein n=1 Tax=Pseudaeromonas paramecii TaxID=2138166 RepID=A0ABP8Q939_9GAMM